MRFLLIAVFIDFSEKVRMEVGEMNMNQIKPGMTVITPMGRRAEVLGKREGSDTDMFPRVDLCYLDIPVDTKMSGGDQVVLQPKLLRLA
jgi:hypothetical protein